MSIAEHGHLHVCIGMFGIAKSGANKCSCSGQIVERNVTSKSQHFCNGVAKWPSNAQFRGFATRTGVHGFEHLDSSAPKKPEEYELELTRHGWQREAAVLCDWGFRERFIVSTTTASEKSLPQVLERAKSGHGLVNCTFELP